MKWFLIILAVIILILGFSSLTENQRVEREAEESSEQVLQTSKILKISNITLNVEVADTDMERTRGLSGKERLDENDGMLFVFDKEGYYGIWMKDMNFPIDIAWLDKDKKIAHMEENVLPETYPKVFNSPIPSLYVLEVSAEFLGKNNIKIGDLVAF